MSVVSSDSDTPLLDNGEGPASPSPSTPPMPPVRLPDAHLDPPPQFTILEIWEAERTHINSDPTATDTLRITAPARRARPTAVRARARGESDRRTALLVRRQAAVDSGYAGLLRLEACLAARRAGCGATADAVLPALAERAWDGDWLGRQRAAALTRRARGRERVPDAVLDLLRAQMDRVAVVRRADREVERTRTERARRERMDAAGEDRRRIGEIREGVREAERREEEKGSRPAAWYETVERLAAVTPKADEWYHQFVQGTRAYYKAAYKRALFPDSREPEEASDDEASVDPDVDSLDSESDYCESLAGDEEYNSKRREKKLLRDILRALKHPKTAHMALMSVFGWTTEDLDRMSKGAAPSTPTPDLPGSEWFQLMLQSIVYAGRTVEAFHNALRTLKDQNDRHGVPTGDTSALNRVGNIATVYETWLMSKIAKITTHISEEYASIPTCFDHLPWHKSARAAFASLIPALTNATTASLRSISFKPLLEAMPLVAAHLERTPYWFRDEYDTMVAVHCLLHLHRYARRWQDRTMWLHGNMSQETVHAYRTRAVRAALGRWVHWSHQARLAVDFAHDAVLELERHSTAARDILRALRAPKPILNRLLDLAKYGRLMGVDGGHVGELLAYAIVWAGKKETMKQVTTEVMLHHAPAEMDYLAATLTDVVQSMIDSPQWGQTAEEEMAVRIGRWVVPSLWEWSKRPENDRPVGARTLLVLHYAKLVERLASMSTRTDTPPEPEDQERLTPQLKLYLRYDDCDETAFRSMADRWQHARLRLTGQVREFVLRHQDTMIERASARAEEQATAVLDEIRGGHTTAAAALQVLKKHSLLPAQTHHNLTQALDRGSEAHVHSFLRNSRENIISRAKMMKTEEIATLLRRMATPGRELKVALQDLSDCKLIPLDKSSAEYQEHQSITTGWNQVLRAELILAHVCGVVGPAWKGLPAYTGPSLIRAFDHYCP